MSSEISVQRDFVVTSDRVRLNLLKVTPALQGEPAQPVVALVPGWSMPASIWRETLLSIGRDYPALAIDPRGQGDSDIPDAGYHIDRRADDLAQCLEAFPSVVLVGWSLGALEALQYVLRHGEAKLAGLMLVDSSVGENPATPPALAWREELRRDREGSIGRFVHAMFNSRRSETELHQLAQSALRMPLDASLSLFPGHLPREHWRDITRSIGVPLLYAITTQFAAQAANLKAARPATRIEIFANAGHALFVDEAARFNAILKQFLDGLPAMR